MSRVLIALFVLALIAPAAVAEQPAAETAAAPTIADSAQAVAADGEISPEEPSHDPAGDLFQNLDPARDLEPTYICMSGCTYAYECDAIEDPAICNPPCYRECYNPTHEPCAGTCRCV